MYITEHVTHRWQERVGTDIDLSRYERSIRTAAAIGCRVLKLPNGHRLLLDGDRVVTVYPKGVRIKTW